MTRGGASELKLLLGALLLWSPQGQYKHDEIDDEYQIYWDGRYARRVAEALRQGTERVEQVVRELAHARKSGCCCLGDIGDLDENPQRTPDRGQSAYSSCGPNER